MRWEGRRGGGMKGRIVMGTGGRGRSKNGVGVAGIELIDPMGTVADCCG